MQHVFVGQWGFQLPFTAQLSLTAMTAMRMVIKRPFGPPTTYDFEPYEFNTVESGDALNYTVREGDLTVPGDYEFQVEARDGVSLTPFEPFVLTVERRAAVVAWP